MLVRKGYKNIIVADICGIGRVKRIAETGEFVKVITPQEELGGIFDFTKENIKKNINLGDRKSVV